LLSHVHLHQVSKVYGPKADQALRMMQDGMDKEEVQAKTGATIGVYDASIEIARGEIFVVMGLSGSGKSTLLRCINRLHEPTSGVVKVGDVDVTKLDRKELQEFRRNVFGMVFQRFALLPHRTVTGNVEYGLEVKGVPRDDRLRKVEEVLELVGLAGWGNHRPSQLSGGMQQRVGLARALAVDPEILLMDEAFSALDPLIKREMQDELLALQERMQKTIIFITHDLDEALKLGDRIAVMKDGRVVQVGTPEEIVSEPADEYVAAFTAGVDRSKVLTAGSVMKEPTPVIRPKDGPKTALQVMRRHGISSIFVVDNQSNLLGLLDAERATAAAERGDRTISEALERHPTVVDIDTPLREVMDVARNCQWPAAVTDARGRLRGVLVKGAILSALGTQSAFQESPNLDRNTSSVGAEVTVKAQA